MKLLDMTLDEWIVYEWEPVQQMDGQLIMVRRGMRPIAGAEQAKRDYHVFRTAWRALRKGEEKRAQGE